jgi:Ca-activated chloride channel family protein
MTLLDPVWLWLLLALPALAAAHWIREKKNATGSVMFSSTVGRDAKLIRYALLGIPYLAYILLIVGLSRPVALNQTIERKAEGIDIVITLDLSGSMKAEDLRPNRFEAAKTVAGEFISNRSSDRIGLVVFARQSFTLVPPTLDYKLLRQALIDLKLDQIQDGTAIGMGIATAVNRLKTSKAASKVIIILTDGENNSGEIDPLTAADLAAQFGIRVYTIGASTEGTAPYPIDDPVFGRRYHSIKVDIDEPMLTEIAEKTGGKYFRARDTNALRAIYNEINTLERSDVEEQVFVDRLDLYWMFLTPAFVLFLLHFLADRYFYRMLWL